MKEEAQQKFITGEEKSFDSTLPCRVLISILREGALIFPHFQPAALCSIREDRRKRSTRRRDPFCDNY